MSNQSDVSRQRIDYRDLPGGAVEATITISLPGGVTKRYTTVVTKSEAEAVEGEIVGAELAMLGPDVVGEIGVSFFKKIGRLAKKVASSKVFALAAKGLAFAAPLLGPLAPAALAASAGIGVAAKLASAGVAAAKGAKGVANALAAAAASDAKRLTKTPEGAAALLASANKKRLGAEKIADKGSAFAPPKAPPPPRAAKPRPAAQPTPRPAAAAPRAAAKPAASSPASYAPMSEIDLLARARAGRVRSNTNQLVDPAQLLAAHQEGRVFWVQ